VRLLLLRQISAAILERRYTRIYIFSFSFFFLKSFLKSFFFFTV